MAKRRDYGFVRSYASIGSDPTQFKNLLAHGYAGALFNYDDPRLDQAVQAAQQMGMPFGFWGDPNAVGNNNQAFINRMINLNNKYHPELLVPDLEFAYRGDPGSEGWNRMTQLAQMWQQQLPGVRTAIAPMGSTYGMGDYNVKAWGPNTEWLPQAYGANPNTDYFGPQQIVESLIRAGVDPSMISPILGPGHYTSGSGGYGGSALWTIDDFAPYGQIPFPKVSGPGSPSQDTGGSGAPTRTTQSRYNGPAIGQYLGRGASQSTGMVKEQGLHWGGKVFDNKQQFSKYLEQRGKTYAGWAAKHAPAAKGLAGRK